MIDDRDFNIWLNFFEKDKPSLTKFIKYLNNKDTYFLNHPLDVDFDHELYSRIRPGGFIEKDVQLILANENPKDAYYKTRFTLFMSKALDLDFIKNRIGEDNFYNVIETALIDGHYEEFDIKFEKLISIAIDKYKLPRTSLIDISFLRGVSLGSRFPSETEEKKLKTTIFKNKLKILIGI